MIHHRRHWAAHLLMICALAAVVMRAVVPVGYMAAREGDRISVTLCGSGHATVLDLGGDTSDGKAKPGDGGVCVFAASAANAPPPLVTASIAAPINIAPPAVAPFPAAVHVGHGLAAPPPQSHAPPVLV